MLHLATAVRNQVHFETPPEDSTDNPNSGSSFVDSYGKIWDCEQSTPFALQVVEVSFQVTTK